MHGAHAAPPKPHAVFKSPISQMPWGSQHPSQFSGLHGGWHVSPWQTSPMAVQFWHVAPSRPHAVWVRPSSHLPVASQQPPQFPGLHVGLTHSEPTHCSPKLVQLSQGWPNAPHCVLPSPFWQLLLESQQPPHVMKLHVGFEHCPKLHVSPAAVQFWHCWPRKPQAPLSMPISQVPVASQHP
jgi:hypothetical protein